MLFMWKMQEYRLFASLFASECAAAWFLHYNNLPIVPVPPRRGKIRKTGWDQIQDTADILRFMYDIPVLNLLIRLDNTQQKKKNRSARIHGTAPRYCVNRSFSAAVPKTVVLLDDIMTTGATLEECATVLHRAGVQKVFALTIFAVD